MVAAGAVLFIPAMVGFSQAFSESFRYPKLWVGEGLVFLAWLGALLAGRKQPLDLFDKAWGVTACAAAVSLVNCSHWLTGFSELMRLVSYVLLFSLIRRVSGPWRLLPLILLAGAVNAGIACAQAGGWWPEWGVRQERHAVYGTFGNPNFLAEYLAPIIILTLGWSLEADRRSRWLAGGGIIGLLLAALLLTVSRSAWLGLTVGGAVFLVLALPALRIPGWRIRLVSIFVAPLLVTITLWKPLVTRMTSSFVAEDPGVTTRVFMWKTAVAQFKEHPWLGVSPGGYSLNYLEYAARLQESGTSRPAYAGITQEAHNEMLQLLAERGLIGALVWLAAFIWLLRPAVQALPGLSGAERIRHATAFGALAAILVECMFGFPMHIFPVAALFLWALACLAPPPSPLLPLPPSGGEGRADVLAQWHLGFSLSPLLGGEGRVRGVCTILLCLPFLLLLGRTMVADSALTLGRAKPAGENQLRAGLKLLPSHGELRFRLGLNLQRQGRLNESTEEFKAALSGFKDPDVYFNLGVIAKRQQRYDDAVRWFQEGLRRYPYFKAQAYVDLAESLLGAGRLDEARGAALRALAIDPRLSVAREILGRVDAR